VQKVTKPNGALVRYQVVTNGIFDANQTKVFVNLESARAAIGKTVSGKSANIASE
jgi:hypothetical protein